MAEERSLFAEVEEVEQLVRAQSQALADFKSEVLARLDLVDITLDSIIALLEPPKPATTLVLTLGKPIPQ